MNDFLLVKVIKAIGGLTELDGKYANVMVSAVLCWDDRSFPLPV